MGSRSCFGNHELLENILQCLGPDSVLEDVNEDARRVAEAVRWRSSRDFSYRPNSPRTCWLDPVTDALTAAPIEIRAEYLKIIKLTFKEGSIDEKTFFPVGDVARAWAKKFLSNMELGEKLAHPEAVINAGVEAKAIVADSEDTERIWNVPSGARFASSDRAASQILSLLARRRVLPRVQTVASLGPPQRAPPRRLSARSTCSFTRRTRAPSTRSARSGGDASRRCRS